MFFIYWSRWWWGGVLADAPIERKQRISPMMKKYKPSSAGVTHSLLVMPHHLLNPKWLPGYPKMTNWSAKGYRRLCQYLFFTPTGLNRITEMLIILHDILRCKTTRLRLILMSPKDCWWNSTPLSALYLFLWRTLLEPICIQLGKALSPSPVLSLELGVLRTKSLTLEY